MTSTQVRTNARELEKHCRFLLQIIDEGYTLRPAERAEIEEAMARARKLGKRKAR